MRDTPGSSGARLGIMVRDVVCRREQWLANASADRDFLTSLIECEIKIAACVVGSGDKISDVVRAATIVGHASVNRPWIYRRNTRSKLRPSRSLPMSSADARERCWRERQGQACKVKAKNKNKSMNGGWEQAAKLQGSLCDKSLHWSDAEDDEMEVHSSSWCSVDICFSRKRVWNDDFVCHHSLG